MKSDSRCCTIPSGKAFVNILADWLLETYGADAGLLSQTLVLLPNRRACRSLRDAFLERSGGRPLLLPRIQPLGEADEEFTAAHYANAHALTQPAITPLCRELILTRLVHAFHSRKNLQEKGRGYNLEQAAKLARQLANLLDDVAREGLSLNSLSSLVEGELAVHWQQTLEFLSIISDQWPHILKEEEMQDIVDHRNQLLLATADLWKQNPPSHPVIAAGSMGSQPAITTLLTTIASLPRGMVILPGLDKDMPSEEWNQLEETHPQFALRQLLQQLLYKREDVAELVTGSRMGDTTARTLCLRAVFQPPASTMHWPKSQLPLQEGLSSVRLITADTQLDEARMIAIALREVLDTPAKTAALVTPDRTLARMVASQMQRFGVAIDDSAGRPLKDTPPACLMRLVAEMVASAATPVSLLAMLRHPLAAAGLEPADCRQRSRQLETRLLRGIRMTPGLAALCETAKGLPDLYALLDGIRINASAFTKRFEQRKPLALHELIREHVALCEWLCSTPDQEGAERLWAGEAGNALASFLAQLTEHADRLEPLDPAIYPGLLETLMAEQVYRPQYGLHPRLHILGPMEARLQHFDRIILGGLNEGTWPSPPEADPWMSRPMRAAFGLRAPEYHVGLAAHDVYQFCHAPEVILSRAQKVEGTPTVPSRWLVRLHTLVGGLAPVCLQLMQTEHSYAQAKAWLDTPEPMPPLEAPAPRPPVSARPRRLRVTAIDRWLRDPYSIYAQYILRLEKLQELDAEPDGAEFGTLVHAALEQFSKRWPAELPAQPLAALTECGREAFRALLNRPAIACLWWPRFESIATWFIEQEQKRRSACTRIIAECKGKWELMIDGKPFTLTTSIDRIELQKDGTACIIDYKTGMVPEKKDFERGIANQLPLESLILLNGMLDPPVTPVPSAIDATEYWKLGSNAEQCEITVFSKHARQGISEWLTQTRASLENLVRRFDSIQEAYSAQANPLLLLKYNDYDHLTRRKEWEAI